MDKCKNAYNPSKVSMYIDSQKNKTLMDNYYTIDEINDILGGKIDLDSVYTKDETYNKDEVYNVSQIDFLLKLKANKIDVYSKIDMNTLLDLKANKNEIYDKNEIVEILDSYYTKLDIDTILENKADIEDVIAISGQVLTNIEDIEYLETNKADKADTLEGYGITDTPSDNKTYGRKNGDWAEIDIPGVMPVLEVFTKKEIRRINPDNPEYNDYYNHNIVPAPNDLSDELNYVDYHIYFSVIGDDTILNNLDKYYICLMRNNKNGSKRGWKIMDDSTSSFNMGDELFDLFSDYCIYPIKLSDCEIANFTTSGKGCIQFKYPYRTSYLLNRIFCIHDEELNRKTPLDLINIGTENQELRIYNPGAGVGRNAHQYHITPNRSTLSYPLKFVLTYGNNKPANEFENPSGQRQAPKSNSVDAKIMINPVSSKSVGHDGQQYPAVDGYTVIMTTKIK